MEKTSTIQSYMFDPATGWLKNPPPYIEPGTRVLCLYRVSSNKQLYFSENNEPEIPMQRGRCRKFCAEKGWTIVCELQEEGVSGHKVRAENRDKIQVIKEYALQKKFDILLVFMFDRLGRISDETPFVLEWFVGHGIRVWSAEEGEQRIDSHTDRLLNYIRFWQADGESQKTSIRTANSLHILTEQGHYTGGSCAYGYMLVKSGRINKKKQEVSDYEICEEEAYVVRLMFRLARYEGYGAQRITNYLNDHGLKNRQGKNWHPSTIQGILRRPLYIGILMCGSSQSDVIERLRIIDDETFDIVHRMLVNRSNFHNAQKPTCISTKGVALLSGFVFCGHCGARLCVTTSGKGRKRADGTDTVRIRYTCQTHSRTHGDCGGQTGYTVGKLDAMIDLIIRGIFSRVQSLNRSEIVATCCQNDMTAKKALLVKSQKDLKKAEQDLQNLQNEVIKAVNGESSFAPETLNAIIRQQEQKCSELRVICAAAESEIENSEAEAVNISQKYDEILEWSAVYENASTSAKKVIVSNLIERVDVYRGYKLKVKLNISVEQFLLGLESISASDEDNAATA